MRERLLIALVAAAVATSVISAQQAACPETHEFERATRTILCDCGCHPQSVHDCACGRAAEMRREIHAEMSEQCLSGDQLIALYVERHGDQIRIAPTATGFNIVAWVGPSVGLVGASLLILLLLRRWRRQAAPAASAPDQASALPVDERYRDRLREALEKLE